ncbi:hypothetical protein DFQ28_001125 [Apophysomyces sp. BC1034]|nr:hypothetical protein DFQ29_000524 [Apophysomyces sp. BC1021]KAG0191001.1 hypothetical protein DFQ28_001125 [Apophysomyces sp. BC1034]
MDTSESLVISVERQMSTSDLPNGVECQASCVKHDEIVPMESEPAENNELATSPECLATSNVNVETTSTKQTDIDHNLQKVLNDGPPYKCCTEIFSSLDQFTCHVETIHASTIHTRHRPSSAEPTRSSSEPLPSIPDQPMMMTFSVQPTTRASGSPSPKNASDTRTKKPAENPANMDRDQRQQAGLLPHFCSMCLMAFGRRQELKRHMWTHEKNSKVYTCEICNKSCSRRDALLRHQRTMHNRHELHVQSMDKSDRITKPASNRNKSPATNGADSFKLLQVQQFNQLLSQKGKKEGSAGMPFQVKEESPPQARAQAHAQEHDRPPIPPLSVISCRDAAPQLLKINCSTPTAFTGTQTDSYSSTSPSSRRGIDQLVKDFMSPHSMNFQHREGQMYLQPASEISSPNKHLAQPIPSNSLPTSATSPWDASPAADSTANLCKRIEDLMTQLERANSAIERHRRKNRDLLVENRVLKSLVTGGKTKRRRSSSPQSIHSPSDMMDTDEDV